MANRNPKKTLKVTFRGVGHGTVDTVRIGVSAAMGQLGGDAMTELVKGAQLKAKLATDPNAKNDVDGQAVMRHGESAVKPFEGVANVSGYSVRDEVYSFSLAFPGDTKLDPLNRFAFQPGKLALERIGDAASEVEEGEGD